MFEPIIETFEIKDRKYAFRKPTVKDTLDTIAIKQQICAEAKIFLTASSMGDEDYIHNIAMLQVGLVTAPENWYEEIEDKENKTKKKVIKVYNDKVTDTELQEVYEKVNSLLRNFSKRIGSDSDIQNS